MVTLAESGHPVFRATSPLVQRSAQEERWWKIVEYTVAPTRERLKLFFSTIVFSKSGQSLRRQSQKCVKNVNLVTIEQQRLVLKGQPSSSYVQSVINTNMPLNDDDDPTQEEFLLKRYRERIEK